MITEETRRESYFITKEKVTDKRSKEILKVLGNKEMTANEIRKVLGYSDLNAVRPRLTELKDKGIIEAVGKKYDKDTKRSVAMFKVVK